MKPPLLAGCLVLVLVSGCAHQDEWTKRDAGRQWAITGLIVVDAYYTAKIQYNPGIVEGTPFTRSIIGLNPSTSDTYQYFFTLAVSQYAITRMLPAKWRPYYQTFQAVDYLSGVQSGLDN